MPDRSATEKHWVSILNYWFLNHMPKPVNHELHMGAKPQRWKMHMHSCMYRLVLAIWIKCPRYSALASHRALPQLAFSFDLVRIAIMSINKDMGGGAATGSERFGGHDSADVDAQANHKLLVQCLMVMEIWSTMEPVLCSSPGALSLPRYLFMFISILY